MEIAGDSTTGLCHVEGSEGSGHFLFHFAHPVEALSRITGVGTERVTSKSQDLVLEVLECLVEVMRIGFRRFAPLPFPGGQIRQFPGPLGQDPTVLLAHGNVAGFAERPDVGFRNLLMGLKQQFQHLSCPAMLVSIQDELEIALQVVTAPGVITLSLFEIAGPAVVHQHRPGRFVTFLFLAASASVARDAESLAGILEPGTEFAAAVDPDRLERVRQILDDGLQEPLGMAGGSPRVHPRRHELAGRAGRPELLERPAVATDRHVVDLHHPAKSGLPAIPGPALRMAGAEVPALAGFDVSAAEPAGLDPVEVHQLLQDAPDGGFRQVPAVTLQHDLESPLAEEGVLLAHPAHGRLVGGRPAGGRDAMRAPAFRLQSPHALLLIALSPPAAGGPGPADHGQGGV